jgi:hypothetical protein
MNANFVRMKIIIVQSKKRGQFFGFYLDRILVVCELRNPRVELLQKVCVIRIL